MKQDGVQQIRQKTCDMNGAANTKGNVIAFLLGTVFPHATDMNGLDGFLILKWKFKKHSNIKLNMLLCYCISSSRLCIS